MFMPTRAACPNDPPSTSRTITVTQTFASRFIMSAAAQSLPVSYFTTFIPGGQTYFTTIQFEKFYVWATNGSNSSVEDTRDFSELQVMVMGNSTWNQPPKEWEDSGVAGKERPRIAFRLGLLDRARFYGVASNDVLFQIGAPEGSEVIVHFTCTVTGPPRIPL